MERSLRESISELEARLKRTDSHRLPLMGLKGAAAALALREASVSLKRPILVLVASAREAEALFTETAFFLDQKTSIDPVDRKIHLMSPWEVAPLAPVSPPHDVQVAQLQTLLALRRNPAPLVIAPVETLMTRTLPVAHFDARVNYLQPGDRIEMEALLEALAEAGYQRVPQVEEPGDFSVRGGIIDVFSPAHFTPVRIELDGDEIVSLRRFELDSQRSFGALQGAFIIQTRYIWEHALKRPELKERVIARVAELGLVRKESAQLLEALETGLLFPGVELLLPYVCGDKMGTVFDYLPKDTLLWIVEPGKVVAQAQENAKRIAEEAQRAAAKPAFHPEPEAMYLDAEELRQHLEAIRAVEVNSLVTVITPRPGYAEPIEVRSASSLKLVGSGGMPTGKLSFEPLVEELKAIRRGGGRALMVVDGASQAQRLRRHLESYGLEINTREESFAGFLTAEDPRPAIVQGAIGAGTALELDGLYVYGEEDLFGEPRIRRRQRHASKTLLATLDELSVGDWVVHIDHGIGIYRGLVHLKVAGTEGDFLNIQYAGDDKLYVPVERINLVQRYVASENAAPKLDHLGSNSWERVKRRTRRSVLEMAAELLEIYAAREVQEGHPYTIPEDDYRSFVEKFEFEETPDQQQAIEDVLRDLAQAKPMDRLICGDAGFGKTEVAMRAAFVVVMEGMQTAVLTPTTVLAEQHYNRFVERFRDYPVRIEMVSRFRSPREVRAILEDLKRGRVDIVIGTHRLLQRDVEFKRLGLVIIDEEHRFGVADKERLKRLRKLVDVLTLTGTPIPRTLHMATLGIRDLSVISTPPADRQAIRTFVAHFDDGLIREAVLRELNRGGQVFFVHNRVENIDYIARHLQGVLPEAKIGVAHGQMAERELERVMRDFIEQRTNVLVCSAIIESGLDIPNANTIIINRADHFGLAQLYQLRGRVGRSRNRAYAYLLIPGEHLITRSARRRIELIKELDEVGGGFRLALHDLELRGAGNLLGREQSGDISAVGFELYTEMMEQAIRELKGEPPKLKIEPQLQLGVPAYIPEAYVPDEKERLSLYRRMARAESTQDLDELRDEMRDRFGPVPTLVENLLAVMELRRRMCDLHIVSAQLSGKTLELKFHPEARIDAGRLLALVAANRRRMQLTPDLRLNVTLEVNEDDPERTFAAITLTLDSLASCVSEPANAAGNAAAQMEENDG